MYKKKAYEDYVLLIFIKIPFAYNKYICFNVTWISFTKKSIIAKKPPTGYQLHLKYPVIVQKYKSFPPLWFAYTLKEEEKLFFGMKWSISHYIWTPHVRLPS